MMWIVRARKCKNFVNILSRLWKRLSKMCKIRDKVDILIYVITTTYNKASFLLELLRCINQTLIVTEVVLR